MSETRFSHVAGQIPEDWMIALLIGQGEAVKYVVENGELAVAQGVEPGSQLWALNSTAKALFFASYLLHKNGILSLQDQVAFAENFVDGSAAASVNATLNRLYGVLEILEAELKQKHRLLSDKYPEAEAVLQ
jgi:hypothetical protein